MRGDDLGVRRGQIASAKSIAHEGPPDLQDDRSRSSRVATPVATGIYRIT
jgi:hypothetical protein